LLDLLAQPIDFILEFNRRADDAGPALFHNT